MKRFDKTKSIKDGYYPIYANNAFTNVNIEPENEWIIDLSNLISILL